MKKGQTNENAAGAFVTIGDVSAPVDLWSKVNTYKSRERKNGRKLKMPQALCEMAEVGAKTLGIKE
jgi:hypothetical protein